MYQSPPLNVGFGQHYPDGKKFDDKYQLTAQPPPVVLQSIKVHYNKYIVGIGFKYKAADGAIIQTNHNLCNGMISKTYHNVYDREFSIQDGDFIKTIRGKHGDWLDKIEFVTYQGANQSFGGTGGDRDFQFEFPGYTFSTVSGSYRDFIDQLSFQIIPLPDHYRHAYAYQDQKFTASVQYPSTYGLPQQNPIYQPQPMTSNYVTPVQIYQNIPAQNQFAGQQSFPVNYNSQPVNFPVSPQNLVPPAQGQLINSQQPANQFSNSSYNSLPQQQTYYNGVNPTQAFGEQVQPNNPDINHNNGKYNYPGM